MVSQFHKDLGPASWPPVAAMYDTAIAYIVRVQEVRVQGVWGYDLQRPDLTTPFPIQRPHCIKVPQPAKTCHKALRGTFHTQIIADRHRYKTWRKTVSQL